jgi:predicted Ser/Thr protein kinase
MAQWDDSSDDRTIVPRPEMGAGLHAGDVVNNTYVIQEPAPLATGGMGSVYLATHIARKTRRAIKVILPKYAADETIIRLFDKEVEALERIRDDAIVRYYEYFLDERGLRYLVMEFVDGQSLATTLQKQRLEPPDVLKLLVRLARGLAAAHERGVVHRDISPENVVLPEGDITRAKLIDFGIAKTTDPNDPATLIGNAFAGKFSFVSPEQAHVFGNQVQVDHRSDIYSLGLVLAAAALGYGKHLDMSSTPARVVEARREVPDLSALPEMLRPVISHMLQPHPDDRPQSMDAVIEEIRPLLGEPPPGTTAPPARVVVPSTAPGAAPAAVPTPAPRKSRLPVIIGGGMVALAAIAGGAVFLMRPGATVEEVRTAVAALTQDYKCAELTYAVAPDRTVTLSGFVSTADDLQQLRDAVGKVRGAANSAVNVGVRPWPYCQVADLLRPLTRAAGSDLPTLALAGGGTAGRIGGLLALDVKSPSFDGYVYIDHYTTDGKVRHLFPNDLDWMNFRPIRNEFVLGRPGVAGMHRCLTLSGQPGQQLVTLIASSRPLFSEARRAEEDARDYLQLLATSLGGEGPIKRAAATLYFDAAAPEGDAAATERCPTP